MGQNNSKTPELKVILVGHCKAGKSSLMNKFCHDQFDPEYNANSITQTAFRYLERNGHTIRIFLCDTSGDEDSRKITQAFYNEGQAAIICYSYDVTENNLNLDDTLRYVREIRESNPNCLIYLCRTKTDLICADDRLEERFKNLTETVKDVKCCFQVSSKTGDGIEDMFVSLATDLLGPQHGKTTTKTKTETQTDLKTKTTATSEDGSVKLREKEKKKKKEKMVLPEPVGHVAEVKDKRNSKYYSMNM